MDKTTWGFILGIIIDLCAMMIMIVIFRYFKRFRSNPDILGDYNVFLKENSQSFQDLAKSVFFTDLKEIQQKCGADSHNYLYLNKLLAAYSTITGFYTILILIPTYDAGSYDENRMHNFGFNNIMDRPDLLIAPMLIFIINTLLFYYILKLYVIETQKNHANTITNNYATRALGFPGTLTTSSLKKKIEKCLSDESLTVYVIPKLSDALHTYNLLKKAKKELLHYLDVEKVNGTRLSIKENWYSITKHDAIFFWEEKIEKLKENYKNELEKSKSINSGVCIIASSKPIFDYSNLAKKLLKDFPLVQLYSIAKPENLIWENIDIDQHASKITNICYTLFFFCIFTIFLTPVSFLSAIYKIVDEVGISKAFLGFLTIFAPEILLLFYQVVIVPGAVYFLVKHEKHHSISQETISALNKYLLFYLFDILFVPAIGMQTVNIVYSLVDITNFKEWSEEMVTRINSTSILFTSLIITQGFLINTRDLFQLGKLIRSKYNYYRAASEREKYNAFLPDRIDYPSEYAILLTYFTAILIFSISYPLILLFGSAYLWTKVMSMQYYVSKYNIMCFYSTEDTPSTAATISTKTLALSLLIFQWVTSFLFILTSYKGFVIVGFLVLTASAVACALFLYKYNKIISAFINTESQVLVNKSYQHPLDLDKQ